MGQSSGDTTHRGHSAALPAALSTQCLLPLLSAHLDILHAHEFVTSQVLDLILFSIRNSLPNHILDQH